MNLTCSKSDIWQVELRIPSDVRVVLGRTRFAKSTGTRDEEPAISTVATASGAAAGAVAGELVNKTMLTKSAVELIIEMKSGSVVSVIQEGGRQNLFAGANVWVITNSGRMRVIFRESN